MANRTRGVFDDSLTQIKLTDFSAGLNTMDGPLSLASNQTPSAQNCIGFPGRTAYVGGFMRTSTLPFKADGGWEFYDVNNVRHEAVWAGGNLYDCVGTTVMLIASNVYTAGQQIGRIDLGGILYYVTTTTALRQWDGTTEKATPNSGATGSVPPPKGTVLAAYAGSLVCGNPTISGTYYPGGFIYCNVNDPTTWIGANLDQLGTNNVIQWIIPLGVSAAGVPPTGSFMIGCSNNIFLYQGPLNSLTQKIVNSPVGAFDPNSAVFLASKDLYPGVLFIGSDAQFWRSNGIQTECMSLKILNLCLSLIQTDKLTNANQRFFASYNAPLQYYICDVGANQQLLYRWADNAWWYVNGWPSGVYIAGHDVNGFPTNYVAANSPTISTAFYQTGVTSTNFGGTTPSIFYNTPYLHGNDTELMKEWQWVKLDTLNNFNAYQVQATTLPRADGTVLTSNVLTFINPSSSGSGSYGVWDVSLWDQALWAGVPAFLTGPAVNHGMLSVTAPISRWVPRPTPQPLRSSAVSFKISWLSGQPTSGAPALDMVGFTARYNPRGRKTIGNQLYTAQSGVTAVGTDPFVNPSKMR